MSGKRTVYANAKEAAAARAEQNRAWFHKRRAMELCHGCGQSNTNGRWNCDRPECRESNRAKRRAIYHRKKP